MSKFEAHLSDFANYLGIAVIIVALTYSCRACDDVGIWETSALHNYRICIKSHPPAECREIKP